MLRQRLSEKFASNPYDTPKSRYNLQEDEPVLSEKKIAIFGLIFSLLVITAKVITNFGKYNKKYRIPICFKTNCTTFMSYIKWVKDYS